MEKKEHRRMDWNLVWTALSVVIPLSVMIFGCFKSLSNDIQQIRERLVVIETTLILKGIMPKELACGEG